MSSPFQHFWSVCDYGHHYFAGKEKNLEGELTCPYKQILPGFLSTETIFFHHGIWNFSYMITLNNRNKSETNDSVDSDKAQWR